MPRQEKPDHLNKRQLIEKNQDEEVDGEGAATGEIEFRFQYGAPMRDDLLSPGELKRLMLVHKEVHKGRVDKQKATREERAALKDGRYVSSVTAKSQQDLGQAGNNSSYKKHPISDKAQFSGIDKQVIGIPTLNEADTNPEMKDALENRYENKYRNTPKFNPKLRPG